VCSSGMEDSLRDDRAHHYLRCGAGGDVAMDDLSGILLD